MKEKILTILRKWSPVFNLIYGVALFLIATLAVPKLSTPLKVDEEILTSVSISIFLLLYFFTLIKLKTIQHSGFKKEGIIGTFALMAPIFVSELLYCIFTFLAMKRSGVVTGWSFLKENIPLYMTMMLADLFKCEIIYFGFASALNHRFSKTQWRAALCVFLTSVVAFILNFITSTSAIQNYLTMIITPIILTTVWLKCRNQILFPIYILSANFHLVMFTMTDEYGVQFWSQDSKYLIQIAYVFLISILFFAVYALYLVLTTKFPLIKRKTYYTKEVATETGQTRTEVRSIVVTKDGVKDEYVGELDTKTK